MDPNIILKVVVLRFPDFITLLIPFSFFLGVVVTISRMYAENEIYGYFSAGLSKFNLLKFLFPQAISFFFSTLVLSLFVAPYTKELSKDMLSVDSFLDQFESIKPNKIFMLMKVMASFTLIKKMRMFLKELQFSCLMEIHLHQFFLTV